MLHFIGLGLGSERDLSLRAIDVLKKCKSVYLESYTSRMGFDVKKLNKLAGKPVIIADRKLVETQPKETILKDASRGNVAFLVLGDVFAATTHYDLYLRAKKLGIKVNIIHNASVFTAVSVTGLSLYKFGAVTSIPFEYENIKSPISIIEKNLRNGYHTLVLLDLDPENERYMSISEALDYLIKGGLGDVKCAGVTALGSDSPEIKYGKADELMKYKFKKYPQSLIIVGKTNFVEDEALKQWKLR
jgi:diphthine synthase